MFITPSSVIQKLTETDAIVKMLEIEKTSIDQVMGTESKSNASCYQDIFSKKGNIALSLGICNLIRHIR